MGYPDRVDYFEAVKQAFYRELAKLGASFGSWSIPQTRSGIRPMRVMTLLRKDREGTLLKKADVSLATGEYDGPHSTSLSEYPRRFGRIPSKEEADLLPDDRPHGSPELLARARNAVKREYKAPTKDQMSGVPQEEDSRNTVTTIENMSTIPGNSTNRQTNVY